MDDGTYGTEVVRSDGVIKSVSLMRLRGKHYRETGRTSFRIV